MASGENTHDVLKIEPSAARSEMEPPMTNIYGMRQHTMMRQCPHAISIVAHLMGLRCFREHPCGRAGLAMQGDMEHQAMEEDVEHQLGAVKGLGK